MNFRRGITPAVISALLLSGCSAPVTENSSPAPISAEETAETEQDTAETSQASSENTSEPEQQAAETNDEASEKFPSGGSVGMLYNMDEEAYPQMVQLSENNIFVDYDYIKNIPSDTAHEKYAYFTDIAVEAVKKSDRYKMVSRWINDNPSAADITVKYSTDGDDTLGDWLTSGGLDIRVKGAYINDFDGDGAEEAFVELETILDTPKSYDYVVFVNYRGWADPEYRWNRLEHLYSVDMLDYGADKQLVFNAYGDFGVSTHSPLIGVRNREMFTHYDFRGAYYKSDCFLMTYGWQCSGEFMVYDTDAHRYYTVVGAPVDINGLYAMDSTGILPPLEDVFIPEAQIIGSKYYAVGGSSFMGGVSFYTYENGAFSEVDTFGADDSPNSLNIRISDCPTKNTILIEGYDKALAEMVTPAEAKKLLSAQ
ncbi:unknown [Eubacterium sp. CAG:786]|nr:unknown [Eubacterium sp. CAG:786]